MFAQILADISMPVSDFKKKPVQAVEEAHGEVVAVLSRNKPVFYAVPADLYERILDRIDDLKLEKIIEEQQGGKTVSVSVDEL